jgi:O-methyltransferase
MFATSSVKSLIKGALRDLGYEVSRKLPTKELCSDYPDLTNEDAAIIKFAAPYTMTTTERLYALINGVRYLCANDIYGSLVECGVWRGGSMMAAARTLMECGCTNRDLYLFDTYEGMPKPGALDRDYLGTDGARQFEAKRTGADRSDFCFASLEDVREALYSTGYPRDRIHFIKGKVEDTLPQQAPEHISLLRLDTDWYESTKHELAHLFPRLCSGGVLIIDDYGHWEGCRVAADEYFSNLSIPILLNRIDYTGRIGVRPMMVDAVKADRVLSDTSIAIEASLKSRILE